MGLLCAGRGSAWTCHWGGCRAGLGSTTTRETASCRLCCPALHRRRGGCPAALCASGHTSSQCRWRGSQATSPPGADVAAMGGVGGKRRRRRRKGAKARSLRWAVHAGWRISRRVEWGGVCRCDHGYPVLGLEHTARARRWHGDAEEGRRHARLDSPAGCAACALPSCRWGGSCWAAQAWRERASVERAASTAQCAALESYKAHLAERPQETGQEGQGPSRVWRVRHVVLNLPDAAWRQRSNSYARPPCCCRCPQRSPLTPGQI